MKQSNITTTREKHKDIGFVITLVLLLSYLHSSNIFFVKLSVLCILVSLVIPVVLKPVTLVWYGISEVMGTIISRVLLIAIFFCIVTPIGVARRMISKKQLQTELWKKSQKSVFKDRNIRFSISDIKNPF
jgi:hypothetical protein